MAFARLLQFVVRSQSPALLRWTYKALYYADRFWAKRGKARMIGALKDAWPGVELVAFDLGAAGGLDPSFAPLRQWPGFRAVAFEPGKEATSELRGSAQIEFHPFAVAGASGTRPLYLTKAVGSSSLFPPNAEAVREFPIADLFEVTGTEPLQVITLDELVSSGRAPRPDFIKLDVQGAEFEILKASPICLQHATGLFFETRMRELYVGEGLFPELHTLLTSTGFRLISKVSGSPHFSGETLELDVAYVRGPQGLVTDEKLIKAVVFCILHENLTFAAHLVRNSQLPAPRKKELLRLLRKDFGFSETPESFIMRKFMEEDARKAAEQARTGTSPAR